MEATNNSFDASITVTCSTCGDSDTYEVSSPNCLHPHHYCFHKPPSCPLYTGPRIQPHSRFPYYRTPQDLICTYLTFDHSPFVGREKLGDDLKAETLQVSTNHCVCIGEPPVSPSHTHNVVEDWLARQCWIHLHFSANVMECAIGDETLCPLTNQIYLKILH
ncbi:hypothetical protein E2C01_031681 [Portunus trituberculatus]|uniref:Uncharacterized protein n=1 Tax=Portunus trituberculatus TaxID=210409 RepID=A0A5B7EYT2_PORTR|nr:hypothetical protein [Portunus trituberculatus]